MKLIDSRASSVLRNLLDFTLLLPGTQVIAEYERIEIGAPPQEPVSIQI